MKSSSIPAYKLNPSFTGFKSNVTKLSYESPKPRK